MSVVHEDNDQFGLNMILNNGRPFSVAGTESSVESIDAADAQRKQSILNAAAATRPSRGGDEEEEEDDDEDEEEEEVEDVVVPQKQQQQPKKKKKAFSPASSAADDDSSTTSSKSGIKPSFTRDEVANMKREMLYQIERLERKGVKIRKFTMQSSFDDIKAELEKVKHDRELDASVRFQRMFLSTCVTGIEFLNNKFDPFDVHLEGWSDSVNDNINDYDEIFEELHVKYRSKARMAPEIKLMFMLGGSAVKFHMTNTIFKSTLPNFNQVMKDNPNLMSAFSEAAMKNMMPQQQQSAAAGTSTGGFGNMFGMIGNLFGGGGQQQPPQSSRPAPTMRGPSNVEDILKDYENGKVANDYVSTYSDVESMTSEGTKSVSNNNNKKKQQQARVAKGRTLDI